MAELLEWLARRLVDEPDAVRVETEEREDAIVFHLHVAPDDVGKVIGKQGRIARALRSIVRARRRSRRRALRARDCRLTPSPRSFASDGSDGRTGSTARSSSRGERGPEPVRDRCASSSSTASRRGRRAVAPGRWPAAVAIKLDRAVERGAELAVPRDALPSSRRDTYYVSDLVGLDVVDERGDAVGVVRDVFPGPANDVLELDTGLLLPFVEDCVREVDVSGRRLLLNPGFTG